MKNGIGGPQAGVATIFGTAKAPVPVIAALPISTPSTARLDLKSTHRVPPQFTEALSPHSSQLFQSSPIPHSWSRGGLND
jgi:hypothetical protein